MRGGLAEAQEGHERAKGLFNKLGDPSSVAYNELRLGLIEAMKGHYPVARDLLERVEITQGRVGEQIVVADARLGLAEILALEGALERATAKADQAEKTFVAQRLLESADRARLLMARIALEQGHTQEAREAIERVEPTATKAENPRVRWQFAITKARLLAAEGHVFSARELLRTVEAEARDKGFKLDELEARLTRGEIERVAGWGEGAVDLERVAWESREQGLGHFSKRAGAIPRKH